MKCFIGKLWSGERNILMGFPVCRPRYPHKMIYLLTICVSLTENYVLSDIINF